MNHSLAVGCDNYKTPIWKGRRTAGLECLKTVQGCFGRSGTCVQIFVSFSVNLQGNIGGYKGNVLYYQAAYYTYGNVR